MYIYKHLCKKEQKSIVPRLDYPSARLEAFPHANHGPMDILYNTYECI